MTRRAASALVFALAFVVLGLPDFAHGVAWPELRHDLHRPLADLGTFLIFQAIGYLLVATRAGALAARWGVEGLVARSTIAAAVGLGLIAVAPVWPVVLLGIACCGAGSGGMDTGFNAAVALRNDARLMGLLHAGYGVGAALGPVVVGVALTVGAGWRASYVLFALVTLALLLALRGRDMGEPPPQEAMGSPRGVLLPCLAFFVYVGLEVTVGQWAFTSLTEDRGLSDGVASAWVAIYWVGLTAGRVWLGLAGHRHPVHLLLRASLVGALAGCFLLWLGGPLEPLGLPLTGLAFSVVFPLLMLVTPERVGQQRAAAAVGWQTAAASIGAAAAPALAGVILDASGVSAYGPVVVVMALLLATVVTILMPGARRAADPVPPA